MMNFQFEKAIINGMVAAVLWMAAIVGVAVVFLHW